jgi:hypothetical protein
MEMQRKKNTGNVYALTILFWVSATLSIVGIIIEPMASLDGNAQAQECDASYPDVCIASLPPNLNCDDIADKNFQVLPSDPHGFDREGDGTGCET